MLDIVPFNEVWNNYVFLDNNKIIGGIKIGSINLSLLFDEEQQTKVSQLKKVLNSIDYKIKLFCIDKPINLENNLNILGSKIKQENNKRKLKLLEEDYDFISSLNNKKSVVNREFFLVIEEDADNETLLNQKINDLVQEFSAMGLHSEKVSSEEWRELLYVILNPILNIDSSFATVDVKNVIDSMVDESYVSQEEMARTYILGLENALKDKLEQKGYYVDYIQFYITQDYNSIAKIEVKMKQGIDFDEEKIKELVLEDFAIGKENIVCF